MRAGLGADGHALLAGRTQELERGGRGAVDHVDLGPRAPAAELDEQGDGLVLGRGRARAQVGQVAIGRGAQGGGGRGGDGALELGVAQERHPGVAQHLQRGSELGLAHVAELVHPGRHQEALEAQHPGAAQRRQVGQVLGHHPTVKADVDPQAALGRGLLGLQRRHRGGGRDRVERHVDDGGDAAGRRRPGRAGEALPLGAPRLVDVHVAVDQPRHHHQVIGVEHRRPRRHLLEPGHIRDDPARHVHAGRPHPLRRHHPPPAHHQLCRPVTQRAPR